MTITCPVCNRTFDDALSEVVCPHDQFISVKTARQKDLAVSLLGKKVAFNHMPKAPVRISSVGWDGMATVDGMSGEFAPHLFTVVKS